MNPVTTGTVRIVRGQLVVGIGNARQQLARLLGGEAVLRQQRQQHARRGAVRFGEIDVEPDNRRAGLAQIDRSAWR